MVVDLPSPGPPLKTVIVRAVDRAPVAEVGTEVRAERVVDVGHAVVVSPQGQVLAEVLQGHDLADLHVAGPGDLEPAVGDGER